MGVRGRLFLISVGLIVAVGLVSVVFIELQLRGWLLAEIEAELEQEAELARIAVEHRPPSTDLDALADALGQASDAEVTVVALDGRLLGSSRLARHELGRAGAVRQMPSLESVLAPDGPPRASARRGNELAVSVRFDDRAGLRGALRLARSTARVDEALSRVRLILAIAGVLGLVVAVLMSGIASHLFARTLRSIVAGARRLADGQSPGSAERLELGPGDELRHLRGSLERIRRELQSKVASLAAETARMEAVLEGTDEAVLAVDTERVLTLVNSAARRLLGLAEDSVGRPLIEVLRQADLYGAVERVLAGGSANLELTLPGLHARQFTARLTPMSRRRGAVIVLREVTQLRQLERMRRDFVANVSHELRTPINVIRVNAETLLDGALDEPDHATRFAEAILRNAVRMGRLVSDLLEISRIESGRLALQPEPVALAPQVADVLGSLEPHASRQGVALASAVPADLTVHADAMALEHVLLNLVDNAIKYVQSGGRVEVVAHRSSPARVRIEVRDDGPGVAPQHRGRLFERFYRVDEGRARERGGTGLGLSIVKHLVLAMDGQVGYEPGDPRGSVFCVDLPAASADAEASGED